VYAPHAGVGVYGGEIDNWRWPRHTGDFAFLRAYVGKDGKPADFSLDNVPYHPPHFLKPASTPLSEGDMVMVAGYPGRTYSLKTAAEVEEAVVFTYPHRIETYAQQIELLEAAAKADPQVAIKAATRLRGLNNYFTNFKGQLEGLTKGGLAAKKKQTEAELQAWIDADPERKGKWGHVLPELAKLHAEQAATRERDTALSELLGASSLLAAAGTVVRAAEEREKPDAERAPAFQERNAKNQEQSMRLLQKRYDPGMDRALLALFLRRAQALPEAAGMGDVLRAFVGKKSGAVTQEDLDKTLSDLYAKTKLGDEESRVKLLKTATTKGLKSSKDPFIRLALATRPVEREMEERSRRIAGALTPLRAAYIAALRGFTRGPLAPDANSTLRITFGTVRGYRPGPDAPLYRPFTTVAEMVAKHKDEEPFDAPDAVLAAARSRNFGPYAAAGLSDVPVDFLSDLHITGGNSGSATLNAKGELVGLAFDGNYEAIASDWVFTSATTRTIHVDLRYMAWIMDAVDGADHILQEMGITPSIAGPAPVAAPAAPAPAAK
jgi:hypothetical protein